MRSPIWKTRTVLGWRLAVRLGLVALGLVRLGLARLGWVRLGLVVLGWLETYSLKAIMWLPMTAGQCLQSDLWAEGAFPKFTPSPGIPAAQNDTAPAQS